MPLPLDDSPAVSGLELVVQRATTDRGFRAQLLAEPIVAIASLPDVVLPRGLRVAFVERPRDVDVLIVLPDPIGDDGALDDAALRVVTAGTAEWSALTAAIMARLRDEER